VEVEVVSEEKWGRFWKSGGGHREGLEGSVEGRRGSEDGRGGPGVGGNSWRRSVRFGKDGGGSGKCDGGSGEGRG
jgi:hypothetical protein